MLRIVNMLNIRIISYFSGHNDHHLTCKCVLAVLFASVGFKLEFFCKYSLTQCMFFHVSYVLFFAALLTALLYFVVNKIKIMRNKILNTINDLTINSIINIIIL